MIDDSKENHTHVFLIFKSSDHVAEPCASVRKIKEGRRGEKILESDHTRKLKLLSLSHTLYHSGLLSLFPPT